MDNYTKEVDLIFKARFDENSEKDTNKKIDETAKHFTDEFRKGFESVFAKTPSDNPGKKIGEELGKSLKGFLDLAWKDLQNIFKEAWKELGNMIDYSRLSNAETRELAFQYGFSGSQAYGYKQAMGMMGFKSQEDLMYATPEEASKFQELMSKYTEKYSQLYDSGFFEEYRDFQIEMQDFKQEMTMEVVKFFMENKDLIKTGMRAIMELAKTALSILSWLTNLFAHERTSEERISATSDIINSYGSTNNTNIKIDNTFNNVSQEDQTWLANAGQMTYEQVIKALT